MLSLSTDKQRDYQIICMRVPVETLKHACLQKPMLSACVLFLPLSFGSYKSSVKTSALSASEQHHPAKLITDSKRLYSLHQCSSPVVTFLCCCQNSPKYTCIHTLYCPLGFPLQRFSFQLLSVGETAEHSEPLCVSSVYEEP